MQRSQFIDNRNRDLWSAVTAIYNVELQPSANDEYLVFTEGKNAIIYVAKDKCIDSVTHELLHIYLQIKHIYIGSTLLMSAYGHDKILKFFVPRLIEHIGNCLCHIKMLPKYLELGFDRQKFIHDYHIKKCTIEEVNFIRENFNSHIIYNSSAVENYIKNYIAIKADPNPHFDYTSILPVLRKTDTELFSILEVLCTEWLNIDVETSPNYRNITDDFLEGLSLWAANKTFL